mgnify:CR=1 FL=1
MNLETINKWLDEEYGCSFTRLEELHNFYIEKYCDLKQENKQLKEQLLVAQTNEETFRLEMKDITKILGLDEDTIFDDVKAYVSSLKENWIKLKEYAKEIISTDNELYGTDLLDKMQELERGIKMSKVLIYSQEDLDLILELEKEKNEKLQQENEHLKMINKEYERLDNGKPRGFVITRVDEYDIYDLLRYKENWNKLKEWVNKNYDYYMNNEDYIGGRLCFTDMKNNMQELEQGSDSNE